jgi:hypothetical protein
VTCLATQEIKTYCEAGVIIFVFVHNHGLPGQIKHEINNQILKQKPSKDKRPLERKRGNLLVGALISLKMANRNNSMNINSFNVTGSMNISDNNGSINEISKNVTHTMDLNATGNSTDNSGPSLHTSLHSPDSIIHVMIGFYFACFIVIFLIACVIRRMNRHQDGSAEIEAFDVTTSTCRMQCQRLSSLWTRFNRWIFGLNVPPSKSNTTPPQGNSKRSTRQVSFSSFPEDSVDPIDHISSDVDVSMNNNSCCHNVEVTCRRVFAMDGDSPSQRPDRASSPSRRMDRLGNSPYDIKLPAATKR